MAKHATGLIFFLIAFPIAVRSQVIMVTAPNGGETLWRGHITVKWTFAGLPSGTRVRLSLWQNGVQKGYLARNVPITDSNQTPGMFYMPDHGGDVPSGVYKLRVQTEDGQVWDESDNTFVYYDTYFAQTGPVGNPPLNLVLGADRTLSCVLYHGIGGTYKMQLIRLGSLVGPIASGLNPEQWEYTWKVGHLKNGTVAPPGAGYRVRYIYSGNLGGQISQDGPVFGIVKLKVEAQKKL